MIIDNIEIKNFKSLKNINLSFSNLTLITGVNSTGKSSLIQSLLLLKQNFTETKKLKLKGEYFNINEVRDILYEEYDKNECINLDINLVKNKVSLNISFEYDEDNNQVNYQNYKFHSENKINLFYDDFQYLETNRVAPKVIYDMSVEHLDNNLLGSKGEYTAHYLNINKNNKIPINALRHSNAITNRLIENTSLWLKEISNGIEIVTNIYPELGKISLLYHYNYRGKKTKRYTPLNVGFGITFVLPIIVAILKAKEGDLLIIENPESHLHPAGQSKIAELCAIASANGVQIIVETHSDHFLNGIRVATKRGLMTPKQSKVYYFRKDKDELETKIDEINIDKNGGIDRYPKGFFDQFDEDLDKLITW